MNEEHDSEPSQSEKLAGPFLCTLLGIWFSFLFDNCFHFLALFFFDVVDQRAFPKILVQMMF